ncbi:hypothetical protein [Deinococcus sp.]|uniref:sodium:solute symporter family transporter n=1 Tax=Deinococcus sp. TaxID=47478 RepID=UPI0025FC1F6C|nr:hypothetical protein [Deinococcus sp.]
MARCAAIPVSANTRPARFNDLESDGFLGNAANVLVGKDAIEAANKAGNMAAPLLAEALFGGAGTFGGQLGLAFVAGLTISASASFTHDIYNGVIKKGQAAERDQFRVARLATVAIGVVAIAASANLPVILFTLFWKKFSATGAIWGIVGGITTCLLLIALSPNICTVDPPTKLTGRHPVQAAALFPLENPGLVSIPAGFLLVMLGTAIGARRRNEADDARVFEEMKFRAYTGAGVDGTVASHD